MHAIKYYQVTFMLAGALAPSCIEFVEDAQLFAVLVRFQSFQSFVSIQTHITYIRYIVPHVHFGPCNMNCCKLTILELFQLINHENFNACMPQTSKT
jgi:hypothetical protein